MPTRVRPKILISIAIITITACVSCKRSATAGPRAKQDTGNQIVTPIDSLIRRQVVEGAIEQTGYTIGYDPAYVSLTYPGGDVPLDRGVCTDVVVRAFRKAGVDLQKEVHVDMKSHFREYPKQWGAKRPDSNIDHRRVPNLMTYFKRMGKDLSISKDSNNYLPGDVVAWDLGNGLLHIGLVTNLRKADSAAHSIVHNIGSGARLEDVLFSWKVIGHYRYF
jgi:uncharacterized protein YijF (DUF1287 family)